MIRFIFREKDIRTSHKMLSTQHIDSQLQPGVGKHKISNPKLEIERFKSKYRRT